MLVKIIIAEKKTLAENIKKTLGCNVSGKGYLTNKEKTIILTRAKGHLLELKKPSDIDDKYKLWKMENLPIFPTLEDKYVPISSKSDQLRNLISIFKNNKDNEIEFYSAGDPDREGELIVRNALKYVSSNLAREGINIANSIVGYYRLWFKDFSPKTIKKEFEEKKPLKDYDNFYKAAKARTFNDWYVGMNLTPFYTIVLGVYSDVMNVGRVLSAMVKIIVDKELEILNFVEKTYFKIIGNFSFDKEKFLAEWYSEKIKDGKLSEKQKELVLADLKDKKEFKVIERKTEVKKEVLKELYNLSNIQMDAEKKYKYSLVETLDLLQKLYEKKVLSYPRANDSGYIAQDDWEKLKETLTFGLIKIDKYKKIIEKFNEKGKIIPNKNFVDDKKVGSHSGLYILNPDDDGENFKKTYETLTEKEKNVLDLIINRILGVLEDEYIYENSEIVINNGVHFFKMKGKIIKQLGWKNFVVGKKESKDIILPNIQKGDIVNLNKLETKTIKTKPPKRYSPGSLGVSLEDLANLVKDNNELKKRIRELSPKTNNGERKLGLGTGVTRGPIIEGLVEKKYIKIEKNKIYALNKGFKLVSILDEQFKDPIMTAYWEDKLKQIEDGELDDKVFLEEVKKDISNLIKRNIKRDEKYKFKPIGEKSVGICPKCKIGEMTFWDKGCSCSYKNCDYIIWYNFLGHTFTEKEIIDLLNGKILKGVNLHSNKKNKDFKADLKLDNNGKIIFS